MNTTQIRTLFAALLCCGLLAAGGTAEARGGGDWDDHGRGWKSHKHDHKHHHRHQYRDYRDSRTVIRERVVIREAPRRYREVHEYHYTQPYPAYRYSRSPAVVIGIDIPPLIIPLR